MSGILTLFLQFFLQTLLDGLGKVKYYWGVEEDVNLRELGGSGNNPRRFERWPEI